MTLHGHASNTDKLSTILVSYGILMVDILLRFCQNIYDFCSVIDNFSAGNDAYCCNPLSVADILLHNKHYLLVKR